MVSIVKKFKNLNPPVKWLIAFIAILLGLSFLFAPGPQPVDLNTISFKTTSSSQIYFRNMRSYYYDIYEREKVPFVLYRSKRRSRDSLKPKLQFMIVENPRGSEAYIFAEENQAVEKYDSLSIGLVATKNEQQDQIFIDNMNNEGHYRLAAKLYTRLIENEQIYLLSRNDTIAQLFKDKREKLAAESTLEDYFKLVNKF